MIDQLKHFKANNNNKTQSFLGLTNVVDIYPKLTKKSIIKSTDSKKSANQDKL